MQPQELSESLQRRLRLPGRPTVAASFEADGSLRLAFVEGSREGWLAWCPIRADEPSHSAPAEMGGGLKGSGLSRDEARSLLGQILRLLRGDELHALKWGPGPEQRLDLSPDRGLGDLVRRVLRPGETRSGPFVAEAPRAEGSHALLFPFRAADEADPSRADVIVRVDGSGQESAAGPHWALDAVRVELRDSAPVGGDDDPVREATRALVGFAVGRALGMGATLRVAETAEASAHPDEEPTKLAAILQSTLSPAELRGDLFRRPWGYNLVSNELVRQTQGYCRFIGHGSRECLAGIPRAAGQEDRYNFTPWYETWDFVESPRVTDFDDNSVFEGGVPRLDRAVRDTIAEAPDMPLFVLEMCDYSFLAEDIASVIDEAAPEAGSEASPNVVGPEHPLAKGDKRWAPILERLFVEREGASTPDARSLNLVGFGPPSLPIYAELESLLASLDVRVAARLFPFLDTERQDAMARARAWVISPWLAVEKGPGEVLERLGDPRLRAPLPYGLAGTRAWLDGVLGLFGETPLGDARFSALVSMNAPQLETLRLRASGISLGFVIPAAWVDVFATPELFFGFAPLSCLADLGFRLEVLVTGERGARSESELRAVLLASDAALGADAPLDVLFQGEGEPLVAALERMSSPLVYTEYSHDQRLLEARKLPFDARMLEPGLAGAERSARRLVARAGATFLKSLGAVPRPSRYDEESP